MKILFIAMSHSIHTARWIAQIHDQGWDIHLFPSMDIGEIQPDLQNLTVYHSYYAKPNPASRNVRIKGYQVYSNFLATGIRFTLRKFFPQYRVRQLRRVIQSLRPDVIHTLETQNAGYLFTETIVGMRNIPRIPIIHSLWGSDLFYFGRQPGHETRIRQVLRTATHLICEGQRDIDLARSYGFTGVVLQKFQAAGGFDIQKPHSLTTYIPPSQRKSIVLKGYQGWAGRALIALQALQQCINQLRGYSLFVINAEINGIVSQTAKVFEEVADIPVTIVPPGTSHDYILSLYGKARLSLAMSVSDGVPNSLLESMAMGAFPIQSYTSCADEWVQDGRTAYLTPPEDVPYLAMKVKNTLQSDELVDHAAIENARTITERLDGRKVSAEVVAMYLSLVSHGSDA